MLRMFRPIGCDVKSFEVTVQRGWAIYTNALCRLFHREVASRCGRRFSNSHRNESSFYDVLQPVHGTSLSYHLSLLTGEHKNSNASVWSQLLCQEIAQQSSEGLLMLGVIFPLGKIGNVAFMAYLCGPIERTFKHSPIYTDREDDRSFFLALLCQRCLLLVLHPSTCY